LWDKNTDSYIIPLCRTLLSYGKEYVQIYPILLLHRGGFEAEVNIPLDTLSQDEIAAVLGTSREVLGRALRQLYDLGLVRRDGRSYTIVDRDGLEKLAED